MSTLTFTVSMFQVLKGGTLPFLDDDTDMLRAYPILHVWPGELLLKALRCTMTRRRLQASWDEL